MTPAIAPHRIVLSLLTATAILASCGSDGGTDNADPVGAGGSAASVAVVEPGDGAEVSGPVTIRMEAEGFEVEAAGEVRPGAGHLHIMIDVGCIDTGAVIPSGDSHLHLGDGATTATLDLAPGAHTICVQAGDGFHTALPLTDTVTFTVTG